jgi:glycosyltransferase involved in cell wall biosynthesis
MGGNSIILVTNILTPYRVSFFDALYSRFKSNNILFKVLVLSKTEKNRHWDYNFLSRDYTELIRGINFNISGIELSINIGLRRKISKENPSVVIFGASYIAPSIIFNTLLRDKKKKTKLFFWSESHLNETKNNSKLKIFFREKLRTMMYNSFDGFLYPGKLARELIENYLISSKKTFILCPNTIEESKNQGINKPYEQIRNTNNRILLLTVSRLSKEKGILEFMEIIKEPSISSKVTYIIVGDGELRTDIERKALDYNLDIRLEGYLAREQIIGIMKKVHFFVLPSLSDPYPLAVIEALEQGLPLLLSNRVGNYPETVIENVNGFIFDIKFENSIEVIRTAINKDETWFINARKNSINQFNRFKLENVSKNVGSILVSHVR